MDVHRDTISVALLDESGRLVMQSIVSTRASAIVDCLRGVRGTLQVDVRGGNAFGVAYDVRVARVVVCNPRKNALLKSGSKSDAIDARKLAELLRAGLLSPVYQGETSALEVQQNGSVPSLYSQVLMDKRMAMLPSPTPLDTRLMELWRASPAANTPGKLVSKGNGWRSSFQVVRSRPVQI